MLLELAAANANWRPRWYYVMRNTTSGMLYVGQTYNLKTRSYCGSGQYWVAHCKKHGGHGRKNIDVVESFFAETKEDGEGWLDVFEKINPNYFEKSNTAWANRALETTGNSAFCGVTKEKRAEYSSAGGLAMANAHPELMAIMGAKQGRRNVESGHMSRIQKLGAAAGGKIVGPIETV